MEQGMNSMSAWHDSSRNQIKKACMLRSQCNQDREWGGRGVRHMGPYVPKENDQCSHIQEALNNRGLRICFCHLKGVPVLWIPMILFWGDRGPGTGNGMRWCMGIMHDAIFPYAFCGTAYQHISWTIGLQTPSPWAEGRRSVLHFLPFSRKFHKIMHITVNYQYSINHRTEWQPLLWFISEKTHLIFSFSKPHL